MIFKAVSTFLDMTSSFRVNKIQTKLCNNMFLHKSALVKHTLVKFHDPTICLLLIKQEEMGK